MTPRDGMDYEAELRYFKELTKKQPEPAAPSVEAQEFRCPRCAQEGHAPTYSTLWAECSAGHCFTKNQLAELLTQGSESSAGPGVPLIVNSPNIPAGYSHKLPDSIATTNLVTPQPQQSAELKERAREEAERIVSVVFPSMDREMKVRYVEQATNELRAFASSIQEEARQEIEMVTAIAEQQKDRAGSAEQALSAANRVISGFLDSTEKQIRDLDGAPIDAVASRLASYQYRAEKAEKQLAEARAHLGRLVMIMPHQHCATCQQFALEIQIAHRSLSAETERKEKS